MLRQCNDLVRCLGIKRHAEHVDPTPALDPIQTNATHKHRRAAFLRSLLLCLVCWLSLTPAE
jgi:hypothetical protein